MRLWKKCSAKDIENILNEKKELDMQIETLNKAIAFICPIVRTISYSYVYHNPLYHNPLVREALKEKIEFIKIKQKKLKL